MSLTFLRHTPNTSIKCAQHTLVVGNKRNLAKPAPLILCGRELPYVKQADHLGNILTEQGDMEQDAAVKRAKSSSPLLKSERSSGLQLQLKF